MKRAIKYSAIFLFAVVALGIVGVLTGVINLAASQVSLNVVSASEAQVITGAITTQPMPFSEAVHRWALSPDNRATYSDDEQAFLTALEAVARADFQGAEPLLAALGQCDDLIVRDLARKSLIEMYWVQQKWGEIVNWVETDPTLLTDSIIDAEDWPMAQGYNTFPPERFEIPSTPVVLPMSTILAGQVEIEVTVNGVKKKFLLDTGADMSVISTDIVEACGIKVAREFSAQAKTSTSKTVAVYPGLIEELLVGEIRITNHPVLIINGEDLEFSLLGIKFVDIDGIIGLPFFMQLAVNMDFANDQITFSRPTAQTTEPRNLFWLESPLVRVHSATGVPLLFFLDTGANSGSITRRLIDRLGIEDARESEALAGGAGGFETHKALAVDSLQLLLGTTMITYGSIQTGANESHTAIATCDGVLGIDIASGGELSLDFVNGRIELRPTEN